MNFIPQILIIGTVFTSAVAIVFISLYFYNQRRRQWHETARVALEKGLPIPTPSGEEEPATGPADQRYSVRNDLRAGLILIAVGSGLYLGFASGGLRGFPMIGAYIPGFIGVALTLNGIITAVTAPKSGSGTDESKRVS